MKNIEIVENQKVDIIASGYEWVCPICNILNKEIEYSAVVQCGDCEKKFNTYPPEHAY